MPEPGQTLRTEDALALRWPSDPRISPDGRWVAWVRNGADASADAWREALLVRRPDDDTEVVLGAGRSAAWSPDGATLAFVRREAAGHALVAWPAGAPAEAARTLATWPTAPDGLAWSPDGRTLAFTMAVADPPGSAPTFTPPWQGLRTADWAPAPVLSDRLVRRLDGIADELPATHHQIFLFDLASGTLRQLSTGPWHHGGPLARVTKLALAGRIAWDPDGRHLLMSLQREALPAPGTPVDPTALIASDLYEFAVADGAVRRLTRFGGPVCQATVSPDGRWIAFVGFRDRRRAFHTNLVHVLPRAGGEPRALPHPQALEVHATLHWQPDSRALVAMLPERGDGCLARVDLDGRWQLLCRDVGGSAVTGYVTFEREFSVGRDGHIAYLQGSPARTDEVAVLPPDGGPPRTVTREAAWLAGRAVAPVEPLTLTRPRRPLQAWLLRPPHAPAGEAVPLVLWLHGGPYAAWGPQFALLPQLWAARGHAVLMPNPRGSLGYGEAFTELLHHDFPGPEDLDLLAAVDEVVARGGIDPERVYVAGESGGAALGAWLTGHAQRFRAAALLFGVYDWASEALTADRGDYFGHYWLPAPPLDAAQRAHCWARSPLAHAARVRTPTLLLCGDQDWRTPFSQSEQYHAALKLHGTESMLARFPGGCHGLDQRPSQLMASADLVADWFARH